MTEWKRGDTAPIFRLAQDFNVDIGVAYAFAGAVRDALRHQRTLSTAQYDAAFDAVNDSPALQFKEKLGNFIFEVTKITLDLMRRHGLS